MNVHLRDYQIDTVNDIRKAFSAGYRSPCAVLPTGSGKTCIFCDIAERVSINGNRVYIIVHRKEIFNQTSKHLSFLGVEHGKIAPGYAMTGEPVQLASVYTLTKRINQLPEPKLMIIDEAHHTGAKTWKDIISHWDKSFILGATATFIRLDGKGLGISSGGTFDTIVNGPSKKYLTEKGFLTQSIIYRPPIGIDMSNVNIVAGDYDKKETEARVDKPKITGCAVEHYIRICNGLPAIAYCATIKHAEHVAERFREVGISSASIDGNLSDTERNNRIKSLATRSVKVLTSCEIISEGTDIPVVSVAILLRPTKSLGLYMQQCGRALRPAPQIGKKKAIILDHVGNCLNSIEDSSGNTYLFYQLMSGEVDERKLWSLEGQPKRTKKPDGNIPALRQCKKCYAIFSPSINICPQCGSQWNTIERKIEQVSGELVNISDNDIEVHRKLKKIEDGQAKTIEELERIAAMRGYNKNWAKYVFSAREAKKLKKYGC